MYFSELCGKFLLILPLVGFKLNAQSQFNIFVYVVLHIKMKYNFWSRTHISESTNFVKKIFTYLDVSNIFPHHSTLDSTWVQYTYIRAVWCKNESMSNVYLKFFVPLTTKKLLYWATTSIKQIGKQEAKHFR